MTPLPSALESPAGSGTTQAPLDVTVLSVVKGNPTPEELAALTAVVVSLAESGVTAPARPATRQWMRRQQLRLAPVPGPGSWRRSRG